MTARCCPFRFVPASSRFFFVVVAVWWSCLPAAQAQDSVTFELEQIGFRGAYKVGSWVPLRVRLRAGSLPVKGRLTVEVPDGDGITTARDAEQPVDLLPGKTAELLTYAKPGKLYGNVVLTLTSPEGTESSQTFRPGKEGEGDFSQGLVQSRRLIALLGTSAGASNASDAPNTDPTGLVSLSSRRSQSGTRLVVAVLRDTGELPTRGIGYESLDGLVIALGAEAAQVEFDPERLQALDRWVREGGRLLVALGTEAANRRAGMLGDLMTGTVEGIAQVGQLRGLEAYCDTGQPIPLDGQAPLSRLSRQSATVLASEGNLPLVVRKPYGFGSVTVLAFDVTGAPFSTWSARSDLWRQLFELRARKESKSSGGRLSNLRINDLASQLYAVLGKFEAVRLVPFAVVAILIFVFLLLAGPGDYFLVRRFLRRTEITWFTFSAVIVVVTGAGFFAAHWLKGDRLRVNKIDLVDFDVETGLVRGTSWFTLFNPQIKTYDLKLVPGQFDSDVRKPAAVNQEVLLSWLGVPEDTIGGMYKQTGVRFLTRAYRYGRDGSSLENVPLETWSTKSFMGRWAHRGELPIEQSLQSLDQSELRGSFTLRLDAPLENCLLAFGDRAYALETLAPNQPVRFTGQYQFRSLNGLLTNKTLIGEEIRSQRYDRASYEWDPLVRMMLFHDAAGGEAYTELEHAYLGFTDLSAHLALGRAILVGTYAGSSVSRVLCSGKPVEEEADLLQKTYLRFVLPVAERETNIRRGITR